LPFSSSTSPALRARKPGSIGGGRVRIVAQVDPERFHERLEHAGPRDPGLAGVRAGR
jgi:hypothetical protein